MKERATPEEIFIAMATVLVYGMALLIVPPPIKNPSSRRKKGKKRNKMLANGGT